MIQFNGQHHQSKSRTNDVKKDTTLSLNIFITMNPVTLILLGISSTQTSLKSVLGMKVLVIYLINIYVPNSCYSLQALISHNVNFYSNLKCEPIYLVNNTNIFSNIEFRLQIRTNPFEQGRTRVDNERPLLAGICQVEIVLSGFRLRFRVQYR